LALRSGIEPLRPAESNKESRKREQRLRFVGSERLTQHRERRQIYVDR
jgi:hypothetical protein